MISIHAPRAGCDRSPLWPRRNLPYFNPRTPCGVRPPDAKSGSILYANFNPRTPCGVRPDLLVAIGITWDISIHAPRAGCDCDDAPDKPTDDISIHAPRAGCDDTTSAKEVGHYKFQSTHPVRGATRYCRNQIDRMQNFNPRTPCGVRRGRWHRGPSPARISIHAPRAGCDPGNRYPPRCGDYFNPRTPCGVRRRWHRGPSPARYFNPRTPCGVRLLVSSRG